MRIAVIGGEARDLVNFRGHLISEMVKAGHTVFGIAPGCTDDIRADIEGLGASLIPISLNRTGLNPVRDLVSLFRLWSLFRKLRLDALLAYEVKAIVFGTIAARFAGVSRRFAMITGRGTTLQGEGLTFTSTMVRAIVKLMYRTALRNADGVLFQNRDDLSLFQHERMLPADVPWKIINGSGVNLEHFALCPLPAGPVAFLFLGRLLKDKGIHEFVEASRSLSKEHVSAHFRILGPLDSNPNALKPDQVAEWAREGVVEYLGESKDVRPAIAAAHVLVLPSYGEGTPRSVLEAMSMGRAIVTTDAPGCRETVRDGVNGYLVAVRDSTGLEDAMRKLIMDTQLIVRFGVQSRQLAETKYDVRLVTADILDFMNVSSTQESNQSST
jgi:glycosyltransferase involved in cell wall biosynthesis